MALVLTAIQAGMNDNCYVEFDVRVRRLFRLRCVGVGFTW